MKKSTSKFKRIKNSEGVPLAVATVANDVVILNRLNKRGSDSLFLSWSKNGVDFVNDSQKVTLKTLGKKSEKISSCFNFGVSRTPNGFVLTYFRKGNLRVKDKLVIARSKDMYKWEVKSEVLALDSNHATVVYDKQKDKFEMYRDGLFIKNQASVSLAVWKEKPSLIFTSRVGQFDAGKIKIIGSAVTSEGIVLVYDASVEQKTKTLLQAGAIVFDLNDPRRVIWRAGIPVWQGVVDSKDNTRPIEPFGFATLKKSFILYWITEDKTLIVAKIPPIFREAEDAKLHPKIMERHHGNPIIEPIHGSPWEGEGTFNPAVVEDDEGIIHLLYRAVGNDGISRIGYARSLDGKDFSNRYPYPVFEPARGYGMPDGRVAMGPLSYNPYIYTSGGGWGGAEDPRAVLIEGRVYMMYTAFEGWNSMRIALTSISVEDFKAGKWKWKKPKLISSPKNRSKNWLLFPEKVNGKFAILHSISPKVLVEYIDDLDSFDDVIHSPRPEGPQPGRKNAWDHLLKGSGPPPVRTELGWLLLYHALEKSDTGKYRLGAMILDEKDPTKVLYRSAHPILSPDMHYENDGKPGVVYASGTVVRGDDLYVYYGGGDKVVCVATTPLKKFLKYLTTGNAKSYQLKKI
ncbi:MAG: Glycosidase ph1107-related protein [Parcubacteria group bacterium Gr01-1014_46]|nr:MAG: Glycosidase ph1107-related protein [Parcubacteria group bacterium Gr01-1014_46]